MSELLVPFLVGVAAFVIIGALVGMLVAGLLDRLTSPSAPADPQMTDDPPANDDPPSNDGPAAADGPDHQEHQP